MSEALKPHCVIVDTNIWCSECLLKTTVGRNFVYVLQRQGGFIGLPEVVELELTENVVKVGRKAGSRWWTVSTLMDLDTRAPTDEEMGQKVKERLTELDKLIHRVPFTLEHAKAALQMVNAKVAPNSDEDQQFKDSAIWQATKKNETAD